MGRRTKHVTSSSFDFYDAVQEVLKGNWMADGVIPTMSETIEEVAKEAAKKLRQTSPGKGKYHKGWAVENERGRLTCASIVYGKDGTYQLAHLLENGHLMRNGKRSRAIVHIAPVAEWANREALNRMYEKLEKLYR